MPLVSFIVLTYNQEATIERALRAAFDQSYPDLEIVVSDDSSTDETWQRVLSCVREFGSGRRVVLNHNDTNLGVAGNVNVALGKATGQIFVMSAGDDYSDPCRVMKIVEVFSRHPNVKMVDSLWYPVSVNGEVLKCSDVASGRVVRQDSCPARVLGRMPCFVGAVLAYHRQVWDSFGPLNPSCWGEDIPLSFRACLLGDLYSIKSPLVYYTIGNGISSSVSKTLELSLVVNRRRRSCFEQIGCDLHRVSEEKARVLFDQVRKICERYDAYDGALSGKNIFRCFSNAIHYCLTDAPVVRKVQVSLLSVLPIRIRILVFRLFR